MIFISCNCEFPSLGPIRDLSLWTPTIAMLPFIGAFVLFALLVEKLNMRPFWPMLVVWFLIWAVFTMFILVEKFLHRKSNVQKER